MPESAPDLVIYGTPVSPFVRKVAACCLEKQAPFEIEMIDVFNPPDWFSAISPMKRIPVLRDRSVAGEGNAGTIADSSAICGFIERKHPQTELYPSDPYLYGRALFIEEYADTALAPAAGMGIFRALFFPAMKGEEPDLAKAKATWHDQMPPIFDYLEKSLDGAHFLAGDALSIADIAVTCCFMQASLVANTPLDNWPALAAHFERMTARPSISGPFAKADAFVRKALPSRFDLT
ncbi:MAG: glutathione S-transferase family protein [Pseudomonadota bacterium]